MSNEYAFKHPPKTCPLVLMAVKQYNLILGLKHSEN